MPETPFISVENLAFFGENLGKVLGKALGNKNFCNKFRPYGLTGEVKAEMTYLPCGPVPSLGGG